MSYTHYWKKPAIIDAPRFDAFVADCRQILAHLPAHSLSAGCYHATDPLELAWEFDEPRRAPELTNELVRFNGKGELGHETFYIDRVVSPDEYGYTTDGLCFGFCKTARKPYDLVAVACLTALKFHVPEVELSSDGGLDDRADGMALFRGATGHEPPLWNMDRRTVKA